jgi:protein involved in sex pheromone biosynthesis
MVENSLIHPLPFTGLKFLDKRDAELLIGIPFVFTGDTRCIGLMVYVSRQVVVKVFSQYG